MLIIDLFQVVLEEIGIVIAADVTHGLPVVFGAFEYEREDGDEE